MNGTDLARITVSPSSQIMMNNVQNPTSRILVVDDEPSLRIGFEIALAGDNREIVSLTNGQDALNLLADQTFDLIVLDLNMPGLTGLDVLAAIRKRHDYTRVVICSAHISERAVLSAVRNGVVDFIAKPFSLHGLRLFVSNVLDVAHEDESGIEKAFTCARHLEFESAARLLESTKANQNESNKCLKSWLRVFKILSTATEPAQVVTALPDARILAKSAVIRN